MSQDVREWWIKALLGEQLSAHPIFGTSVDVTVENGVVTLTGYVDSADQAQEIEREAEALDEVRGVVNRLKVRFPERTSHMQTVLAVFGSVEEARLACQAISGAWQMHEGHEAHVLDNPTDADLLLQRRAEAAQVGEAAVRHYVDAIRSGKALLVDRVPEDDALRVLSVLEGQPSLGVTTLPPEPGALG